MQKLLYFCLSLLMIFTLSIDSAVAKKKEKTDWPSHLVFLCGPNGGQWFTLGNLISEILNQHVLPTSNRIGGGAANIGSIENKKADIGFTLTCFMGAAGSGEAEYESFKTKDTEFIANVYPQVLYILLRRDFADKYKVKNVRDFLAIEAPVRFASLKPGTASEFILNMLLKYGYDTSFEQLKKQKWQITFNNYAETADNFVAGELDCFAYTAGTDVPLIKTMEEYLEVVILPIERNVLETLSNKFKTGIYTIQPGDYANISKPIETLGDYTALIARKDLPDDLVYKVLEVLYANKDYIAETIVDFNGFSPETAIPAGLSMHPGALKFWTELKEKK